ncbi:hypothetical protein FA13DRAFT_1729471 [Coprinellus micaceus]|uniref:Uncharacterized protein n=1 Tax=Coprinellus micaceus TaxID=71717 RepID=A0A4Y7TKW8_COPMI|nr:hypothetical protein FA13DRAFT_1729471 [Coprinellus micaceus]
MSTFISHRRRGLAYIPLNCSQGVTSPLRLAIGIPSKGLGVVLLPSSRQSVFHSMWPSTRDDTNLGCRYAPADGGTSHAGDKNFRGLKAIWPGSRGLVVI